MLTYTNTGLYWKKFLLANHWLNKQLHKFTWQKQHKQCQPVERNEGRYMTISASTYSFMCIFRYSANKWVKLAITWSMLVNVHIYLGPCYWMLNQQVNSIFSKAWSVWGSRWHSRTELTLCDSFGRSFEANMACKRTRLGKLSGAATQQHTLPEKCSGMFLKCQLSCLAVCSSATAALTLSPLSYSHTVPQNIKMAAYYDAR